MNRPIVRQPIEIASDPDGMTLLKVQRLPVIGPLGTGPLKRRHR